MQANKIIISIVIHNQAKLVEPLIEDLLALKKTYSLKIFLRVNTNEDVSNLKRWDDPIAAQYGVTSIPQLFLLDENGKVVAREHYIRNILPILEENLL